MQTPCIHVCTMVSATGFCAGCGRTLQEIGGWMNYTDAERRGIMAQLPARLATAGTKSQIKMRLSELPERPL
ncbi:DUF1289 domain-containing protein [Rhizobium lentis]|uniref:DUF1289 domain-containing protein n=1 Tax=Rhizobium lentis TaxID=1138194 RepID=UPI001A90E6AB|nr:DUF1289 domain-containing protein [Rhizobium lentis]MBX5044436.1 DUF1289 domain-containing protein [Rhizobium lentis]MBX5056507.1 DUF1289 domain-containing protein [Rhizobium lentis]MBX5063927.1 DUF1289 domain-containing protein [Rhizobium lentis]MBX5074564.1 DUF1289 domain-containing protein [Rhizobium lentis]MBX5076033.1 DUF1289 domain-containing protein [Rhizobium lentis]